MSSVDEILALRKELAEKQAARQKSEVDAVDAQRQVELDKEAERLRREIAEEDTVASLLAAAGQNPEQSATFGTVRSDEEILAAHEAAVASVYGTETEATEAEVTPIEEPAKAEAPKTETPKLTTGAASSTASGAAKSEEEK